MFEQSLASYEIKVYEPQGQNDRINELRERAARCVCRYCGEKLTLRKITYAAYDEAKIEVYCEKCDRIEYGVEPEIYQVAKYFADEIGYDHYPSIDNSVRKSRMNIAVICDIISWGFKNTGLLDKDGFKVKLDLNAGILGEALLISNTALNEIKGE